MLMGAIAGIGLAVACKTGAPRESSNEPRAASSASARGRTASDSDWAGRPVTQLEELFAGRFPGVHVFNMPGQGIAVRIRGATSVMGSNEPLYVVDGFPIEVGPGGLLAINPGDIAKIEVLKDAGSTAEYGVRGANGVVVITTKRNR
jgi:TonB-dependent starch-binding outer membrane protein SusC